MAFPARLISQDRSRRRSVRTNRPRKRSRVLNPDG
jgi:hypothetical protein